MSGNDAQIIWRPFFLRPETPLEGIEKAPDTPDNRRVGPRLKSAGAAVGIDFTGKTDRSPNTFMAHRLLKYAEQEQSKISGSDVQNVLAEILFRHYFTDGKFPNLENLKQAATEAGLNADEAAAFMNDEGVAKDVWSEAKSYKDRGVSGVPYFIIDGKGCFSGAQPPEAFLQHL